MVELIYNPNDLRYIFFRGDGGELRRIEKHFNPTPSYMFLPSFSGVPKPEVFFHKFRNKQNAIIYYIHSGLWKTVTDWCAENNISVKFPDNFNQFKYTDFNMTLEEFTEYVMSWGLNITPYDYQIKAAWTILHYRQSLSQLATRSGKTVIGYMIFRYLLEHGAHNVLMIVPNTTLIKQAVNDFQEYGEYFLSETVWADGKLCEGSNLTVGTFQSLVMRADKKNRKYNPKFFEKYDVVLVDEAHTLKCKSIDMILSLPFMKHVKLKFGFSGSLPDEQTIDSFCCHSLMGPTIQDIRSHELIELGFLAKPHITQIRIKHELTNDLKKQYIKYGEYLCGNTVVDEIIENGKRKKIKKLLPKEDREFTLVERKTLPLVLREMKTDPLYNEVSYMEYLIDLCKAKGSNSLMLEQMLLHRDMKRINILYNLLDWDDSNCILFCHHTEYLNYIYQLLQQRYPNRSVYKISGQTSVKKREKIINDMLKDDHAILVASYGVLSTGVTLKKVKWGAMLQSFKSQIINKQSLGRLMVKNAYKDQFELYDFVDVYPTGRIESQGKEKVKLYKKEQIEYTIVHK